MLVVAYEVHYCCSLCIGFCNLGFCKCNPWLRSFFVFPLFLVWKFVDPVTVFSFFLFLFRVVGGHGNSAQPFRGVWSSDLLSWFSSISDRF